MLACQKEGKLEAIRPLLEAGASFSAKSEHLPLFTPSANTIALTALHIACNNGQYKKAAVLLHHGAPVDGPDGQGLTPLQWAVTTPHLDCVTLLLENGANCNVLTPDGVSIIDLMKKSSYTDIAIKLFEYGAPYPKNSKSQELIETGLKYVCLYKKPSFKKLIDAIVHEDNDSLNQLISQATKDVLNEADVNGMTPLIWASIRGNIKAVNSLLAPQQSENFMTSALRMLSFSNLKLVNIAHVDQTGRTARDWANRLGHKEIEKLLLSYQKR